MLVEGPVPSGGIITGEKEPESPRCEESGFGWDPGDQGLISI